MPKLFLREGREKDKAWLCSFRNKGSAMASGTNIDSARNTYAGFVGLMKWGTIACFAVGAMVVLIIAR